jgi:regulator of protease activity HflC (stomatin/prohibitin superfamily)
MKSGGREGGRRMGTLMRKLSITSFSLLSIFGLTMGTGCAGALVQPGHRGLFFDPTNGGIQHEVLQPGWYRTACSFWEPENKCPRVDDFDVTFSTAKEEVHTLSNEKLPIELRLALKYRPIVSELYLLDTEIGANYFEEVIGPEFRSAAIGVVAHISYQDMQRENGKIEDEIEKELRHRLQGKHIEVASVLLEKITYAPQIVDAYRQRVVSQEETLTQKQLLENAALQKKRELELQSEMKKLELESQSAQRKMELAAQTEQKKMQLSADAEQRKLVASTETEVKKMELLQQADEEKARIESELRNKRAEKTLALEQAQIDKMKSASQASTVVITAKGEAESRLALADALAAENRAAAANVTMNQVMMHAYDALGQLGGTGTTFLLGDYSKLPDWLFPKVPGFQTAPWLMTPAAATHAQSHAKATHASLKTPVKKQGGDDPYGDD